MQKTVYLFFPLFNMLKLVFECFMIFLAMDTFSLQNVENKGGKMNLKLMINGTANIL